MRTVLLIEDDPEILEFERAVLSLSGYDVLIATNGREGIETLRTCRPSAIVLDLMMPVMDGLTFLAARARQHLAEGVPVICVSAQGPFSSHEPRSRARRSAFRNLPILMNSRQQSITTRCGSRVFAPAATLEAQTGLNAAASTKGARRRSSYSDLPQTSLLRLG